MINRLIHTLLICLPIFFLGVVANNNMATQYVQNLVEHYQFASTSSFILFLLFIVMPIYVFLLSFIKFTTSEVRSNLKELDQTTKKIILAARNLSESNNKMLESSTEQADASHQCVSALDETNAMIERTKDRTNDSKEAAHLVLEKTSKGQTVMGELDDSVKLISESQQKLQGVKDIFNRIMSKTSVINDIVFQTKILSFNASVEAARAGVHGNGFSIVAQEVGKLAAVSGESAKEINDLLQVSETEILGLILETKERVTKSQEATKSSISIFDEITRSIKEMDHNFNDVDSATNEQLKGVKQSGDMVRKLDEIINENNKTADHTVSISKELISLSRDFDREIKELNIILTGKSFKHELKNTLNIAGRQRMLTQKMSKEAIFLSLSYDVNTNQKQLRDSMLLFENSLKALRCGDRKKGILRPGNSNISKALRSVSLIWSPFKKDLRRILDGDKSNHVLERIERDSDRLLNTSVQVFSEYEKCSHEKNANNNVDNGSNSVDLAGKQRMLSQKMAKEYLFIQKDINKIENQKKLKSTMNLFVKTIRGLAFGDSELKLPGTTEPTTKEELKKLDKLWNQYSGLFTNSNSSLKDYGLIFKANLELLEQAEQVVQTFLFWTL